MWWQYLIVYGLGVLSGIFLFYISLGMILYAMWLNYIYGGKELSFKQVIEIILRSFL
jgi:hypothetical protein